MVLILQQVQDLYWIVSFIKISRESSGGASRGYLEFILEYTARELFNITDVDVDKEQGVIIKTGRNKGFKKVPLEVISNLGNLSIS